MDFGRIAVRALFAYVFVVLIVRLSGKRVVAEATTFDFVLAVIIGDMFDDLFWAEVPAAQFVVATSALVVMEVGTSMASYHSRFMEWLIDGPQETFMRDGKPVPRGMRREKMNELHVEMLLRQKEGLERERWHEVREAKLMKDGQPSIVKHEWAREAQKADAERVREAKE